MKTPTIALLGFVLFLTGRPSVRAQVVAAEDFESYAVGAELAGLSGGSGFGGSWAVNAVRADQVTIVAGSLSYSNGAVNMDGGTRALQFAFDPAEGTGITDGIMVRPLETPQTGTVYMSLLFRDTANTDFANDFIQWGFSDGTSNPQASILRRNGTLQVRSTTNAATSVASEIAAAVGETHLLVFKAEKTNAGNYNRVSLFVDPDSEIEPVTPSAVTETDSGLASFPNFVSRSAFHDLDDAFQIDNLLIGESWEDVIISARREPFAITAISYDGSEVGLTWNSRDRHVYAVLASDDLATWWELDDGIIASATTASYLVTGNEAVATRGTRYFRIEDRGRMPD